MKFTFSRLSCIDSERWKSSTNPLKELLLETRRAFQSLLTSFISITN